MDNKWSVRNNPLSGNPRIYLMRLILNIIFGGVISVFGFASWSVSVMISNLNDYKKPVLNRADSLSLAKIITRTTETRMRFLSLVQPISAAFIDRNKHYLGLLEEILQNKRSVS